MWWAVRWRVQRPSPVAVACAAAAFAIDAKRARDLAKKPVPVLGFGQGHPGGNPLETLTCGARRAGRTALAMAGIGIEDVDVAELYDCYTFTVLIQLEDYGFCAKGESGAFVESGATARGGSLPTNTGGGQLSSFYMWGMTPMAEAVIQMRGEGGGRVDTTRCRVSVRRPPADRARRRRHR